MSLIGQLQAKFKGVSFYVRNESIDQLGQKMIVHDYPQTQSRYVEPQGKVPNEFSLDIFFAGITYQDDFKLFKSAIEDSTAGRLYLPTFGIINNVVALPASASASQESIGEISMTVKFSVTITKPSPTKTDSTTQDISYNAEITRALIGTSFIASFSAPSTIDNITTAISDTNNLAIACNGIVNNPAGLNVFLNAMPSAISNPTQFVSLLLNQNDPLGFLENIAVSLSGNQAFNTFTQFATFSNNLSNSVYELTNNIQPFPCGTITIPRLSVNTNINLWDNDTYYRQERNQNRLAIVNLFRMVGLIGMYEAASGMTYTTTEDITTTRSILDSYYEALIENDTTGVIIPQLKYNLDQIKGMTYDILKAQNQNVYSISTIQIDKPYSVKLLTYDLYSEYIQNELQLNTYASIIQGLNRSMPAHLLQGIIKVINMD
jgi:hypothetical protein